MSAIVYVTDGPQGRAGYFRCDKNGVPQITNRRHAERFVDALGASGVVELLAGMNWSAEVREV